VESDTAATVRVFTKLILELNRKKTTTTLVATANRNVYFIKL
jgi:hypothetical protein